MSMRRGAWSTFCLSALIGIGSLWSATGSDTPKYTVLDAKIARFKLSNQTLFDGLSALNSEGVPLAFGFEHVLKVRASDPPIPDPPLTLELENTTVRKVLDTLCTRDPRFTWSSDGAMVNVYPRYTVGNPTYLLNRTLDTLKLTDILDPDHALLSIAHQLPMEQIGYMQLGGDTSYVKPWTTTLENLTVRQAINLLARHMGPRGSWTFSGSRESRMFSFYKEGFVRESK